MVHRTGKSAMKGHKSSGRYSPCSAKNRSLVAISSARRGSRLNGKPKNEDSELPTVPEAFQLCNHTLDEVVDSVAAFSPPIKLEQEMLVGKIIGNISPLQMGERVKMRAESLMHRSCINLVKGM
jgi:hypothetical protein